MTVNTKGDEGGALVCWELSAMSGYRGGCVELSGG